MRNKDSISRYTTVVIALLFIFGAIAGQGIPTASPEEVGFSSERLERIDPLMQSYIELEKLPGMVTLVARKGKVIQYGAYGKMRPDRAMESDVICRIASMTKPITSAAVMMLYEEGKFLLSDPVSDYIPQFKSLKVFSSMKNGELVTEDAHRSVTIHDLLTHTSGLTYGFFGNTPVDSMYNKSGMWYGDLEQMVNNLSELPLLFQPGDHWNYSVATDVLGYLVEVVSGMKFDVFLQERILGPLGMDDTAFYVPEDKQDRVMPVYRISSEGNLVAGNLSRIPTIAPSLLSGGGGLYSTISDYARFAQMILNEGELEGSRILGRKSVELMISNHLTAEQMNKRQGDPGVGFGLGFSVVIDVPQTRTLGSEGTAGWSGINNTYFSIDPKEELITIVMTQFSPYGIYKIQDEFKVLVYQALIDKVSP